jgi:PEP-CTERM motif-containing protein
MGGLNIEFRIYGGGDASGHTPGYIGTGYSADAQYVFTGIGFDVPASISNVTFTLTNIADFSAADISFTGDSVSVRVANLGVLANSDNLGTLRLNLVTGLATEAVAVTAVPEPATISLLGIGLIAGWRARRKSRSEGSS